MPPENPPGGHLAGRPRFTLLDGGPMFKPTPSLSFFVGVGSAAEADEVFGRLAEGGKAFMPIDAYPWSGRHGWVGDRFGVTWQVMAGPPARSKIVPCLMLSDAQYGRAEEAMKAYTAILPDAHIGDVERYAEGDGDAGTAKHGRLVLAGQDLVAMDSHVKHGFAFDEGQSLQVLCADQPELDRHWDALAEGGSHGRCGWLKDRFGLSWQVVPARMAAWMADGDTAGRDRVFVAVMTMSKLDVASLERLRRRGLSRRGLVQGRGHRRPGRRRRLRHHERRGARGRRRGPERGRAVATRREWQHLIELALHPVVADDYTPISNVVAEGTPSRVEIHMAAPPGDDTA